MDDIKEYIERGALMAQIKATPWSDYVGSYYGRSLHFDINEIVERQPEADVVEVVRCGECAKYQVIKTQTCTIAGCRRTGFTSCNPDDYCSYGERKDGDNNAAG